MQRLEEWQLRKDLETIRTKSERLASLQIVPPMIRPTVLLVLQLRHPTNPGVVQMLAAHRSDTTTMGYVNKLPGARTAMQAFLDDSKDDNRVLVYGGLIASADQWRRFSKVWQQSFDGARPVVLAGSALVEF